MKHTRESVLALIAECRKTGKQIDLSKADLSWTDLSKADLSAADLDFSCFPLWCGSFGIFVDKRLVSQLLYHLCRFDVKDCPEWDALRNNPELIALANQSHVIEIHNLPKIKEIDNGTQTSQA